MNTQRGDGCVPRGCFAEDATSTDGNSQSLPLLSRTAVFSSGAIFRLEKLFKGATKAQTLEADIS